MKVEIHYFASLRESAKKNSESWETEAPTVAKLYEELQRHYNFSLPLPKLMLAVNDIKTTASHPLTEGDKVVFIPPVAGG